MRAYSLLRANPWYRRQAFELGLKRAGYQIVQRPPDRGCRGDVLLIWNRYGPNHEIAAQFERQGGVVLVAENGYLGHRGSSPKFDVHPGGPKPWHYYALAKYFHNGRGYWPSGGGADRFSALEVALKPWRTEGEHVLVCPNRSFGVGEQVMDSFWAKRVAERLAKQTKRPVRIRAHPGNDQPKRAIADDLQGAWVVVVWSSTVALHALAEGIPTYIEAPFSVVKGASASGPIDAPVVPERLPHFERMAHAQWRLEELESGVPFRNLLSADRKSEVPPGP